MSLRKIAVCGYALAAALLFFPPLSAQQSSDSTASPAGTQTAAPPPPRMSVQERLRLRREQRSQALARETYGAKYEAFFGGGYLRFRPGSSLQRANEVQWNAGVTRYYSDKWGVNLDFRGYYSTPYTPEGAAYGIFKPSIYQYSIMLGPQRRIYAAGKYSVSLRAMGGPVYGNFTKDTNGKSLAELIGLYPTGVRGMFNVGAAFDYNFDPKLSLRITPEYVMTTFGGEVQNNLGWSADLAYRFGKR